MLKLMSAAILLTLLAACASSAPVAKDPYGSPDGQRQRAGGATQELDRNTGNAK